MYDRFTLAFVALALALWLIGSGVQQAVGAREAVLIKNQGGQAAGPPGLQNNRLVGAIISAGCSFIGGILLVTLGTWLILVHDV